ncbi:class I SAM-dependent DNA methyltransferase [bacterium]
MPILCNERITENIVREHFKKDTLYNSIKLEEQKSYSKRVVNLLKGASKSGKGIGKPEFIISFPLGNIDYLMVVECKGSSLAHCSKTIDSPKDFAVDGVLNYAKYLSKEFDVIAVAVSGQNENELLVSHFRWKKGQKKYTKLKDDTKLLFINDYIKLFNNEQFVENIKTIDIIKKAIDLNEEYQAYSITELTRCTIVSAILLSLLDDFFRKTYKDQDSVANMAKAIISAIENVLKKNKVRNKDEMMGEYRKILNEPIFKQDEIKHKKRKEREKSIKVIKEMIDYLHKNVYPLVDMDQSGFDVLGRFYTEFIRYAGNEKNQGLVLTPFHVTDLFCDLARTNKDSIIYDPCCGTGGFLISGMKYMLAFAGNDQEKKKQIKAEQLVGVELRPSMFTYACSNMMMRGDGKSNIYCGDCFVKENEIKNNHKPDIAVLNPPYDVGTTGQMHFIEHALNVVAPRNGTVIAIVQMSCGIKNEKELIVVKNRILAKHHLKAVLSMPDDLFYPVGVVTSIMVFKANEKNTGRKTWFGYFKDDGFEKRKHKGRIDARGKWDNIKNKWLSSYHNSDVVSGLSVKQEVTGIDEWCAEAYMETDYSTLTEADFEKKMKDFIAFKFLNKVEE